MKKLLAYCEKIGADYEPQKYGNNYFYNVPAVTFNGACIMFDYESRPAMTEAAREIMIEKYLNRYGYKVLFSKSWPGFRCLHVMKKSDFDLLETYDFYTRLSVSDCEKIMHNYTIRRKAGEHLPDREENEKLRAVMDEYGNNLNTLLKSLETKTA